MIVSCESCKSRYKLDDSKITGRGAKITCPKCKHVFVVLAPPPAVAESPSPMLPQGQGEWEDEEPTRVGREAAGAAAAPEPPVPGEHEVVRPRSAAAGAPAAPAPTRESIAARAATLDFRKVGVNAWKVKVRIGLVYDFSDIKTLRKYIQDGRVTPADVISHDGKTWKPLGEIPDLDAFFVEAYERLETEYAGKAPVAKDAQPAPADLGNVAAALAAAAAAELDEEGGGRPQNTGPVYEDPFEALKQRQRDRGPGRKPGGAQAQAQARAAKDGRTVQLVGLVVLLLVLGGGGWWFFGRTPPAPPPVDKPVAKAEGKAEGKAAGKATTIADDPSRWKPQPEEPKAPPAPLPSDCPAGFEWNQKLQNCVQTGPGPGGRPPPGGASSSPTVAPGAPGPATTQGYVETDDEAIGDGAMKNRDYNTAVIAYGKAVSAGKAAVRIKLGEAQLLAGDDAAAMGTLTQAAASNKKAYKLLGELKEKMGDPAGAKAAYGEYLSAFPKDSAVKAKLDALGG